VAGVADAVQESAGGRRRGGLREIRAGVWRIDTELPAVDDARRRVSRTIKGSRDAAEAALSELIARVADSKPPVARTKSGLPRRAKWSGAITRLAADRWLIGVEGEPDPVTGQRRRHTRVVNGDREQAEVALARLQLLNADQLLQRATAARTVRAACELYLREARTEKQTLRTDRAACNRICQTVLPGGALFGEMALTKVNWKLVERVYDKWGRDLTPAGSARYASTLSKVFDHAKRTGWIRSNPAREARSPKVPSRKPDVPNTVEVHEALRVAKERDFMTYACVIGIATMGCRRSELLALTVRDLDLRAGVATIRSSLADGGAGVGIYVKATKRDDWRDVPLTEQMVEVFEDLLARRKADLRRLGRGSVNTAGFVFSDDPDGSTWMRPDTTSQRWLAARGDCPVTFAMLRRYVATELLDVTNGDYRTVASITGNTEETLRRWYDAGPNLQKKKAVIDMARL
jgi:integrase